MKSLRIVCASMMLFHFAVIASAASVLRDAIMKLPPSAVGDIPLNQRGIFLDFFKGDSPKDRRLDEKHGAVSFYSDGETPFRATSAFDMKVFTIKGGGHLVFCCRSNPDYSRTVPRYGITFIFKQQRDGWVDVTDRYLPPGISSKDYFQPRRKKAVVEGGTFEKNPDSRKFDLVWDGKAFVVQRPSSAVYDYDFQ